MAENKDSNTSIKGEVEEIVAQVDAMKIAINVPKYPADPKAQAMWKEEEKLSLDARRARYKRNTFVSNSAIPFWPDIYRKNKDKIDGLLAANREVKPLKVPYPARNVLSDKIAWIHGDSKVKMFQIV